MQVSRLLRPALLLGLVALAPAAAAAEPLLDAQEATGLMRTFVDSKKVLVRSMVTEYAVPLRDDLGLSLHWNNERVRVPAIAAAPGTQEAVDAITTASRPISGNAFQDYVKVRNEFEGEVSHGGAAVQLYHSAERDYLARQLGASYNRDFMNQQFNVSVGGSYGWDAIKPLANVNTTALANHKNTLHWDAVATRILTPTTLVRLGAEYNHVEGLQHNPYRRVYAGGTSVPENHPSTRERRDVFFKLNQYFENRSSVKLDYRLYSDSWGVVSQAANAALSQYVTRGLFAQYEYRYYVQTSASFYEDEYATTNGVNGYLTGDYRLGPLSSHLFGVSMNLDLASFAEESEFLRRWGVTLDYERYFNSNNYSADILETELSFRF